jgi:hypothetical protein
LFAYIARIGFAKLVSHGGIVALHMNGVAKGTRQIQLTRCRRFFADVAIIVQLVRNRAGLKHFLKRVAPILLLFRVAFEFERVKVSEHIKISLAFRQPIGIIAIIIGRMNIDDSLSIQIFEHINMSILCRQ